MPSSIRHEEHLIQVPIVRWARAVAKSHFIRTGKKHPLDSLYAIPNGEARPAETYTRKSDGKTIRFSRVGKRLKDEGVLAGMPDLCLPCARKDSHALYIEVKAPGGKKDLLGKKQKAGSLSDAQKERRRELIGLGNCVIVAWSADEGIETLKWYLGM